MVNGQHICVCETQRGIGELIFPALEQNSKKKSKSIWEVKNKLHHMYLK